MDHSPSYHRRHFVSGIFEQEAAIEKPDPSLLLRHEFIMDVDYPANLLPFLHHLAEATIGMAGLGWPIQFGQHLMQNWPEADPDDIGRRGLVSRIEMRHLIGVRFYEGWTGCGAGDIVNACGMSRQPVKPSDQAQDIRMRMSATENLCVSHSRAANIRSRRDFRKASKGTLVCPQNLGWTTASSPSRRN